MVKQDVDEIETSSGTTFQPIRELDLGKLFKMRTAK